MISALKVGLGATAVLVALAIDGVVFIGSGVYNIGADDHHTKIVLTLIEQLRDRSIAARSRTIAVPAIDNPEKIGAGAQRYAALGVGCHLAPGVVHSDIRSGLYPHPPDLAQEETLKARKGFWTIKHGIKMSAMPAWGKVLDDPAIWEVVAFVRQMPAMTPETYRQLSKGSGR